MRTQDLNLLMVFDAIMTERSITRAAERLAMTQPAVSNAVSRMRTAWKDELFVKNGRNIQPTLHAHNLWGQIKEPVNQLRDAIDPQGFDPATAQRTFRIAASDIAVDMAWAELRKIIEAEAPGINLHSIPYNFINPEQILDDAKVDLVIGANPTVFQESTLRNEYLFDSCYVCVMRPNHPLARGDLTVEEFAAADHMLVSLSGDTNGFTDQALMRLGMTRRIAMTVNHFSVVVPLIRESNMIAVLPTAAVEKAVAAGELAVVAPPVDIEQVQVCSLWHKRQDRDGGLIWLRDNIKRIITTEWARHTESIHNHFCPAMVKYKQKQH